MAESFVLINPTATGALKLIGIVYDESGEIVDLQQSKVNHFEEVTKFARNLYHKHNIKPTIQFA